VKRPWLLLGCAIAAVTLSACDTGYKFTTPSSILPSGTTVPGGTATTDSLPGPTSSINPKGSASTGGGLESAPGCVAAQLAAEGGRRKDSNDSGWAIGDVIITNSSTAACELQGVPLVHLYTAGAKQLGVNYQLPPTPTTLTGVVIQPKESNSAEMVFVWKNWCSSAPGDLDLRVQLSDGGGTFQAPLDGSLGTYVPECSSPSSPSVIEVQYAYVPAGQTKLSSA
jgi:Protein of unknown function (DUF4232)